MGRRITVRNWHRLQQNPSQIHVPQIVQQWAQKTGIAQQSSKLSEIFEELAQRPEYQRFKTKHDTSEEISFLVRKDEEKSSALSLIAKKNMQLNIP
jgi:hypothetical protein